VLSVLTGVFALAYPLRPIHLSILSWFTIGMPAFFLALAPNDQRVAPGFLRRVLGRAVPAGLVIAALTMAARSLFELPSTTPAAYATALAAIAIAWPLLALGSRVAHRWGDG